MCTQVNNWIFQARQATHLALCTFPEMQKWLVGWHFAFCGGPSLLLTSGSRQKKSDYWPLQITEDKFDCTWFVPVCVTDIWGKTAFRNINLCFVFSRLFMVPVLGQVMTRWFWEGMSEFMKTRYAHSWHFENTKSHRGTFCISAKECRHCGFFWEKKRNYAKAAGA